jgi:FAD/FMN-containing dehydrogenase
VFWPGAAGYELEKSGYNGIVIHKPALIVGAEQPDDVVAAVRYAAARGMSVAVQATGHGISFPADGVLVSTRRMTGIEVDAQARTARVEAGVVSRDLLRATTAHGLAPLNGSSPAVGVIGYTLGGGVPLLGRLYGYAADRVRSIDVVTADGVLRRVTSQEDSDLFWALLGGKGNFGVVTSLEIELVAVSMVIGGGLWFTGENIGPAVHAYAQWTREAPEAMSSSALLMKLPDIPFIPQAIRGQHVAHIRILHVGDAHEATGLVNALREAAPIAADTVTEMSYGDVGTIHNEPEGPVVFEASNTLLAALDDEAVDTLLAHAGPEGADAYLVELRHLGGRLASQEGRRGSTGRRDGLFTLYAGTALKGADRTVAAQAQARLHRAMARWATDGVCPSFLSGPAVTFDDYRSGFDEQDFARLQKLKARFDPTNMFRINHNIPPVHA